jgi:hypothetical protein
LSLDLTDGHAQPDDSILFVPISLSNFKRLTHIRLNPVFLTGRLETKNVVGDTPRRIDLSATLPELLPVSLERLRISNAQCSFHDIASGLQKLLLNKQTTHPVLRELVLEGSWANEPDCWSGLIKLWSMSTQARVTFIALDGEKPEAHPVELRSRWGMDDEYSWSELGSGSRHLHVFNEANMEVLKEAKVSQVGSH